MKPNAYEQLADEEIEDIGKLIHEQMAKSALSTLYPLSTSPSINAKEPHVENKWEIWLFIV